MTLIGYMYWLRACTSGRRGYVAGERRHGQRAGSGGQRECCGSRRGGRSAKPRTKWVVGAKLEKGFEN